MRQIMALASSALLIDLVLIQPNHPSAMSWQALRLVPLELPVLLLGCLAIGRRAVPLAALASLMLTFMIVLKLADFAIFSAFDRGFDPLADMHLLPAGVQLLSGTVGRTGVVFAGLLLLLLLASGAALLFLALRLWARTGSQLPQTPRVISGVVALMFVGLCVAEIRTALNGWTGWQPPGSAFTSRLAAEHLRDFARSHAELAAFKRAADNDPWQENSALLSRLEGRDVVIVFVESYGRAAFDNPLYGARHADTLSSGMAALETAGLVARSGWLQSPVIGGQSWLAHGTFATGLEVQDQRRYNAMLASPRQSLFSLATKAGYATAAFAPAIVMPWPEGSVLGFQSIYAAADLGYQGQPFNWVTMPDQYTLSAFDRIAPRGAPLMAEVALISSHAPWTPVPKMVAWDQIGDGRVFDAAAVTGPSPREVWADPDRIRDHYARALDYSLQTVLSWAALPRAKAPLLVVLGDHQAAGFVSQYGGKDVPIHLIGPPEAIALFDTWQWSPVLTPDAELAPWPMQAFRDRFLAATSATTGDGS
ncbi:sulfatase-like hydrolase/transferase [Pseudooceanicola spongiae]|uniref:Sulfatase-like hydrolase/transferase n=1 Tax=Pseudooceanicola spongiae TaxID=2613965 RepID=A0A7L9WLT2_9RHOB|nr:sulfatase-like hydrolase/transferase [Pseudooceanicola spongiae]QOL80020.1 sulfatase-like hydrolase/transferase [Pseudooceanicola spongiae]